MITKIKKYGADWCKPCKTMDTTLAQTNIPVEHFNIDEMDPEELEALKIRNIPVCLLINEAGEVAGRIDGALPLALVQQKIKSL